jgi:hypothetical protein
MSDRPSDAPTFVKALSGGDELDSWQINHESLGERGQAPTRPGVWGSGNGPASRMKASLRRQITLEPGPSPEI